MGNMSGIYSIQCWKHQTGLHYITDPLEMDRPPAGYRYWQSRPGWVWFRPLVFCPWPLDYRFLCQAPIYQYITRLSYHSPGAAQGAGCGFSPFQDFMTKWRNQAHISLFLVRHSNHFTALPYSSLSLIPLI